MAYSIPWSCPACAEQMAVTELTCPHCATKVQGVFAAPGPFRWTTEQWQFVEVFLRCRGNIREVERELNLSYPTVRARLDQVIQAMGYASGKASAQFTPEAGLDVSPAGVLDALGSGELTFEEALRRLKEDRLSR